MSLIVVLINTHNAPSLEIEMSSLKCNIDEDNEDIKKACNLAKHGKFDPGVYNILRKKPHLVNFIPEGKGWAIMHHAVYWNYLSVVVRLLEIPSLDLTIKTHPYPLGHNKEIVSLTPKELAEYFLGDRKKIIKLLTAVEDDSWKKRFNQDIKFFVSAPLCVVITRRASALNVGQTMRATYSTQLATQPEARGISPLH